jgi:hypothetical protein
MSNEQQQKTKRIEPSHVEENWTIIHLPNGDKLKTKHVVMGVMAILDESGKQKTLDDGTPCYGVVFSQPIVGLLPKEEQRKTN